MKKDYNILHPHPENTLKECWGYSSFRPLQKEIIKSILAGQDTLALLPTGGGKSVCYQLPALLLDGFCLIVSPLIALMQDQVARLKKLDVMAECIHSGMHYNDVKRVLENMIHGPYKMLYVSPERLQTDLFLEYLPHFNISFIAVDEGHCISQWGHDFRPDYLKIASLRNVFEDVPVLALTASATTDVQKDIITQLQLSSPAIFRHSFERSNIYYELRYTENKNRDVSDLLSRANNTNIIYCRSRKQTEVLSKYLQQQGIPTLFYHAGMSKEKREQAQQAWMKDEVKTIIATTAFGMGIDKADVRVVIHYDAPEHLEAWYQETGRAGRDEQSAHALTLYNKTDINNLLNSIDLQFPKEAYLRLVYQSVVEYLQVPISAEPNKYYAFDLQDFCKKFKLQAVAAMHALRLLEQEGLWTLSEAVFKPATLYLIADRQELTSLADTYPDLGMVVTVLLRLYGTLFIHPTVIHIGAISKQLKIKQELAEQLIQKLQEMEILEYRKPLDKPQMFFHHYRVDSNHLIIDLQRIATLRKRHEERTKVMVNFLENTTACRNRILLDYFGEQTGTDCMHCDVCKTKYGSTEVTDNTLRARVSELISTQQNTNLQELGNHFPYAIRQQLMTLIRAMVDEGSLHLKPDGTISQT